ncbi:MAG: tRNA lysidine(34) synthetase TilS [Clostridia bacterium]|nr:tRNA lysidine(34) synthetase TilS [Clostridia bacterium]
MILETVLQAIEKYHLLNKGDKVVVGLSGGPDSVCLLHILHSLVERMNIKLYAVHVNHLLRGQESELDEQYAGELCDRLGVKLYIKRINIKEMAEKKSISLEEAGREARYAMFESVAGEVGADKVAVAHNKNDQVETLLMRMIRGTGLEGLKGIERRRDNVIRPLLDISRKEIEEYCLVHRLEPRTDSSNLKNIYTRNKIRLDLIPYMNALFETDITEPFFRMANLLKEDHEYIEGNAIIIYNQCIADRSQNSVQLDIPKLVSNQAAIAKRIVRLAIKEVQGDAKGIEYLHIEKILELASRGKTGSILHLPNGLRAMHSYGVLKIFYSKDEPADADFETPIIIPGRTCIESVRLELSAEVLRSEEWKKQKTKDSDPVQFFDFEKLSEGIHIRNRRNGDVFRPFKSNGTKKLKEYFIDCKIPREERGKIPLIARDREIVWIIGYKISDKFTVTENTKSVLKLTCLKWDDL